MEPEDLSQPGAQIGSAAGDWHCAELCSARRKVALHAKSTAPIRKAKTQRPTTDKNQRGSRQHAVTLIVLMYGTGICTHMDKIGGGERKSSHWSAARWTA